MNIKNVYAVGTAKLSALAVVGAALLPSLSAFAENEELENQMGVMSSFNLETAGTELRDIVLTVLGVVGAIYGAVMGFYVLRWAFRKVRSGLGG